MPRDDEQPQPPRRYPKARTGEPRPLSITSDRLKPRLSPPPRTDEAIDEGYAEMPRKNSSIRYSYNTNLSRTGNPSTNTPIRRQTGSRDPDTYSANRQTGPRDPDTYSANRQIGSRDPDAYFVERQTRLRDPGYPIDRQTGPQDANYDIVGRQTGPRDTDYNTGRQTTRNIPSKKTQDTTHNLPPNRTRSYPRNAPPVKKQDRPRRRVHWFLPIGIGMMAMIALWLVGSSVVGWSTQIYNTIHYGYPRTYQVDAVVGHNHDSPAHPSHFIAINLNRQAVIIEIMAGDVQKSVTYVAPVVIAGDGGDLAPVTLEFRDVTGDHRPDMIVHIHLPTQDEVSIFVNDGTKFRPSNSNDKIHL